MSLRVGGSYGELFAWRGGTHLLRRVAGWLRRHSAQREASLAARLPRGVGRDAPTSRVPSRLTLRGGSSLASSVEAPFGSPRSFSLVAAPTALRACDEGTSYRAYLDGLASLYAANRRAPAPTFATPQRRAS